MPCFDQFVDGSKYSNLDFRYHSSDRNYWEFLSAEEIWDAFKIGDTTMPIGEAGASIPSDVLSNVAIVQAGTSPQLILGLHCQGMTDSSHSWKEGDIIFCDAMLYIDFLLLSATSDSDGYKTSFSDCYVTFYGVFSPNNYMLTIDLSKGYSVSPTKPELMR